jgi:formate--tetrahydrofolate ligase
MGLSLSEYVVTEAGFGADLGAEKFFDIKCVTAGLNPEAVVIVVTVRALRYHGGAKKSEFAVPNVEAVQQGVSNLEKHVENIRKFNLNPIVAINAFDNDSEEEIDVIKEFCSSLGVKAVATTAFSDGGDGAADLAAEVVNIVRNNKVRWEPLYNWNISIEEKIHCIATEIYGAKGVEYSVKARQGLKLIKQLGFDHMPVCMAKTPKSLTDDERKLGRPRDFIVTVREFEFASGAGFIIPILGEIMRMPGLPLIPAAESMDIDSCGKIVGLF